MDSLPGVGSDNVRFTPESGHNWLGRGMSAFDPERTFKVGGGKFGYPCYLETADSKRCGMRKVVDSNFLQRGKLREYLSKSTQNYVVLTDYAAMEAYKDNTLASIYRSMEIPAQYPKQVIVLKGTQVVCGLSGRGAGLQRRLIDEKQTREFSKYCRDLFAAERGNLSLQKGLLDHGRTATTHMNNLLDDAANIRIAFDKVARETYTDTELRVIRKGVFTEEIIDKLIESIFISAAYMFRDHPQVTKSPNVVELPNTFIFRMSLCLYLLLLRWTMVGGARKVSQKKMRNDMVDITFAAYATYFDGLLTADKKLNEIYRDAATLLPVFFPTKTK